MDWAAAAVHCDLALYSQQITVEDRSGQIAAGEAGSAFKPDSFAGSARGHHKGVRQP
jgi:hypothetical protein